MVRELARRDGATREFLMRVTHDLRTPLTAIRGHASALADGVVPEANVPRSIEAIENESERLEGLVADLLDLARIDARRFRVDLTRVDPLEALSAAAEAVRAQADRRSVQLSVDLPDELPTILSDERRVRQIVGNLLDNALRWTSPGGRVALRARSDAGASVEVTVTDDGPGIAPDRRESVFNAFTSSEAPDGQRGAGLGLAISRELARALGGDLHVEGAPGGGSHFVLRLISSDRETAPLTDG